MEQLNHLKMLVISISGGLVGALVAALGGWSEDLTTLLWFMGTDFLLGLAIAAFWKKSNKSETGALSSWSAWKGLCKKGTYLLIILIANRLDVTIGVSYIRTAVIIAFIANEGISIIENLGVMGIPFPQIMKDAIELLTKKAEKPEAE